MEAAAAEAFGVADQLAAADDTLAAVKAAAAASVTAAAADHKKATGKAEAALSRVLGKLVAEKLGVPEIAELTSLSAADVRRLTKPASTARKDNASAAAAPPAPNEADPTEPGGQAAPSGAGATSPAAV